MSRAATALAGLEDRRVDDGLVKRYGAAWVGEALTPGMLGSGLHSPGMLGSMLIPGMLGSMHPGGDWQAAKTSARVSARVISLRNRAARRTFSWSLI
jgi:hypothetical protein